MTPFWRFNYAKVVRTVKKGRRIFPQTADKGTEHEKDIKFALIKKRIREVNPRILFDFSYFFVQNEPRLTVLPGSPQKCIFVG